MFFTNFLTDDIQGGFFLAGWQVILCDPIWHVSSRSGEASRELLYSVYFTLLYFTLLKRKNPWFTAFLDSNLHTRLAIVTKNELGLALRSRNLP